LTSSTNLPILKSVSEVSGRVGDQPPAPEVGRQLVQRLIGEDSAAPARAEFAALVTQPVKALDHIDRLPRLA
jgi:hypothetical protein